MVEWTLLPFIGPVHFQKKGVWLDFFTEIPVFNVNRVVDQTPRSAAFDLNLHCLSMSFLFNVTHKEVLFIPCFVQINYNSKRRFEEANTVDSRYLELAYLE